MGLNARQRFRGGVPGSGRRARTGRVSPRSRGFFNAVGGFRRGLGEDEVGIRAGLGAAGPVNQFQEGVGAGIATGLNFDLRGTNAPSLGQVSDLLGDIRTEGGPTIPPPRILPVGRQARTPEPLDRIGRQDIVSPRLSSRSRFIDSAPGAPIRPDVVSQPVGGPVRPTQPATFTTASPAINRLTPRRGRRRRGLPRAR